MSSYFTINLLMLCIFIYFSTMDWKFVVELYKRNAGLCMDTPGLSIVLKIKFERIYLTSFSKMRVDLAVQVSHYKYILAAFLLQACTGSQFICGCCYQIVWW